MTQLSSRDKRKLLAELLRRKNAKPKIVPLSFAQQRLWFLDQLSPGNAFYNVDTALPLDFPLDLELLEKCLNEMVERHEGLRTTFRSEQGEPVQCVAPALRLPLPVIDLTQFAEAERRAEAKRLATEEAQRPFDLATGPLIRATLLHLGHASYILLVTIHHIVADGWSLSIFFQELGAIYNAFSDGLPSPLPDLPIQYADFAVWQRQWLQGEVLQAQVDYWKRQLAELPSLQLPLDRPRPAVQTYCGAYEPFSFSAELSAALKALCQAEDVTIFMTLLSAFQVLLGRYTGQEDIAVGTPIAGRNRVELEAVMGFFVNTLVLRTDLSGDPSFRDVLRRARETALGAYAHQDLPFEMLVGELQPERDLSRNPLFQVMFQLFNPPSAGGEGWTEPAVEVVRGTSIFDLALHIGEGPHGLAGNWEYSTDLFDRSTILRFGAHLTEVLRQITANPDVAISRLRLLDGTERRRMTVEWNQTAADYPSGVCLHHLFERQARETPGSPALLHEGATYSYRDLDYRANRLASGLRARGVGPDVPVCISMERSPEIIVAVLGVLKAGGACVPVDPGYPAERRARILEDSGAPVVLTADNLGEFDGDGSGGTPSGLVPENLAYILYTSGSTGVPKGVAMPHGALTNLLAWQAGDSQAGPGTRTLQFASLNFDVSFQELFSTWNTGGTLVLISEEIRRDAFRLLRFLASQRVERLFLPFVALNQLAEAARDGETARLSIREIMTAGEQLRVTPQVANFCRKLGCTLFNQYGPTETHVVTSLRLDGDPGRWPTLPPIGRPISNLQMYILDRHLEPAPVGAPGELYIGGAGLARGYWNSPDLTAEKFVSSPFGRLYRTGDLARYRTNGEIDFLGRLDQQVKIRGFRVELGEIETVLERHPAVRHAVVVAKEDASGQKRLFAYVAPVAGGSVDPGEVRRFVLDHLPEYMAPQAVIVLDQLPLLPSGKVNRRALPEPDWSGTAAREHTPPRSPVEEKLAGIWRAVLNIERVGVYDNFFADLGGHSLLATQLTSRVRDAFSVDLPLTAIFEHPTVAAMSEWIAKSRASAETRITPVKRELRRVTVTSS